jgi:uncharacterized membrane protein YobD (UPF0266 family)
LLLGETGFFYAAILMGNFFIESANVKDRNLSINIVVVHFALIIKRVNVLKNEKNIQK